MAGESKIWDTHTISVILVLLTTFEYGLSDIVSLPKHIIFVVYFIITYLYSNNHQDIKR